MFVLFSPADPLKARTRAVVLVMTVLLESVGWARYFGRVNRPMICSRSRTLWYWCHRYSSPARTGCSFRRPGCSPSRMRNTIGFKIVRQIIQSARAAPDGFSRKVPSRLMMVSSRLSFCFHSGGRTPRIATNANATIAMDSAISTIVKAACCILAIEILMAAIAGGPPGPASQPIDVDAIGIVGGIASGRFNHFCRRELGVPAGVSG